MQLNRAPAQDRRRPSPTIAANRGCPSRRRLWNVAALTTIGSTGSVVRRNTSPTLAASLVPATRAVRAPTTMLLKSE